MDIKKLKYTRAGLKAAGFQGFQLLHGKREDRFGQVPEGPGIYAVLRDSKDPVEFLEESRAGLEPTPTSDLTRRWVSDAQVVYIGNTATLQRRLGGLAACGAGQIVAQWGGRVIWQIADSENLMVAWYPLPKAEDAAALRTQLLDDFLEKHAGQPPFGNAKKGARTGGARPAATPARKRTAAK